VSLNMALFDHPITSNKYILTTMLITLTNKKKNKKKLSFKCGFAISTVWNIGQYYWMLLICSGFMLLFVLPTV